MSPLSSAMALSWTGLINFIVQRHLLTVNTVCLVENDRFNSHFQVSFGDVSYAQIVSLKNGRDPGNFFYSLKVAIEEAFCESFVVFGDDILQFLDAFVNASLESRWRSRNNRFLLVTKDGGTFIETILSHPVFDNLPNVLVVEDADNEFTFWTTKFTGYQERSRPVLVDTFCKINLTFGKGANLYPDKLFNQMGRPLRFGSFTYKPFTIIREKEDKKGNAKNALKSDEFNLFIDGTEARILIQFCEKFNCTVHVLIEENKEWGYAFANLTGDGLLGFLIQDKVDVVGNAFYMCRRASWLLPFQPFSTKLWIAIAVSSFAQILTTFTIYVRNLGVKKWRNGLTFSTLTTFGILIGQGNRVTITHPSMRMVLIFYLFMSLVTSSGYGGGLSSTLTVPSHEDPIDNVADMTKHNLEWAGTTMEWLLSIEQTQDEMIKKVVRLYRLLTEEEMARRSLSDRIGFVVERLPFGHYSVPDYISPAAINRLKIMLDDIYYEHCILISTKLWSNLDYFDDFVLRMQESGIVKLWEWETVTKYLNGIVQKKVALSSYNILDVDDGPQKLGLANFLGIIAIWTGGILFSIFVFFVENFIKRKM